jgi:hypothetical protein
VTSTTRWQRLLRELRYKEPLENQDLYVEPAHAAARRIDASFRNDPDGYRKFLLVGSRGGGKSTELRRLAYLLSDRFAVATVDLDASGLVAENLGAFDLLYVSGLALLLLLPDSDDERKELFGKLAEAYAGEPSGKSALGTVAEALGGVATFGAAVGTAAVAAGIAGAAATGVGGVAAATAVAIRLFKPGRTISASEAQGQKLLAATAAISERVRFARGRRVCLLVDGLERMNGEAEERFRAIFKHTRLLDRPPWCAVFAAPPAMLTTTLAASQVGYEVEHVYGFGL